ncbi:MAG: hypothetical protein AB7N54_19780 [Alphaproteobacteria bacterium]
MSDSSPDRLPKQLAAVRTMTKALAQARGARHSRASAQALVAALDTLLGADEASLEREAAKLARALTEALAAAGTATVLEPGEAVLTPGQRAALGQPQPASFRADAHAESMRRARDQLRLLELQALLDELFDTWAAAMEAGDVVFAGENGSYAFDPARWEAVEVTRVADTRLVVRPKRRTGAAGQPPSSAPDAANQ